MEGNWRIDFPQDQKEGFNCYNDRIAKTCIKTITLELSYGMNRDIKKENGTTIQFGIDNNHNTEIEKTNQDYYSKNGCQEELKVAEK